MKEPPQNIRYILICNLECDINDSVGSNFDFCWNSISGSDAYLNLKAMEPLFKNDRLLLMFFICPYDESRYGSIHLHTCSNSTAVPPQTAVKPRVSVDPHRSENGSLRIPVSRKCRNSLVVFFPTYPPPLHHHIADLWPQQWARPSQNTHSLSDQSSCISTTGVCRSFFGSTSWLPCFRTLTGKWICFVWILRIKYCAIGRLSLKNNLFFLFARGPC